MNPRFVIFTSYGNDSVALIQWAKEQGLRDVVCVYSNTGWAAKWWQMRVENMERWVEGMGYSTARTESIGFVDLARQKKSFPGNAAQWCSGILKIEPGERWLTENDPEARAVCLVGVRREEGPERKNYPAFLASSNSHGGRVLLAPMAEWTEDVRNVFLERAGFKPLPHRSMECFPCINSNKTDLKMLAEDPERIEEIAALEDEMGINGPLTKNGKIRGALFRPANRMGAVGIHEVVKWAKAPHGKYRPPAPRDGMILEMFNDDEPQPGCESGWCGV